MRLGVADAVLGASSSSIAGSLVVCWLFASILVNSAYPSVSRQIENSRIIRGVEEVMPPIPDAFSSVERYLGERFHRRSLVNVLPESVARSGYRQARWRFAMSSRRPRSRRSRLLRLVAAASRKDRALSSLPRPSADSHRHELPHVIAGGTQAISVITAGGISHGHSRCSLTRALTWQPS